MSLVKQDLIHAANIVLNAVDSNYESEEILSLSRSSSIRSSALHDKSSKLIEELFNHTQKFEKNKRASSSKIKTEDFSNLSFSSKEKGDSLELEINEVKSSHFHRLISQYLKKCESCGKTVYRENEDEIHASCCGRFQEEIEACVKTNASLTSDVWKMQFNFQILSLSKSPPKRVFKESAELDGFMRPDSPVDLSIVYNLVRFPFQKSEFCIDFKAPQFQGGFTQKIFDYELDLKLFHQDGSTEKLLKQMTMIVANACSKPSYAARSVMISVDDVVLPPSHNFFVRIGAKSVNEIGYSEEATYEEQIQTPLLVMPMPPQFLRVDEVSSHSVNVSWSYPKNYIHDKYIPEFDHFFKICYSRIETDEFNNRMLTKKTMQNRYNHATIDGLRGNETIHNLSISYVFIFVNEHQITETFESASSNVIQHVTTKEKRMTRRQSVSLEIHRLSRLRGKRATSLINNNFDQRFERADLISKLIEEINNDLEVPKDMEENEDENLNDFEKVFRLKYEQTDVKRRRKTLLTFGGNLVENREIAQRNSQFLYRIARLERDLSSSHKQLALLVTDLRNQREMILTLSREKDEFEAELRRVVGLRAETIDSEVATGVLSRFRKPELISHLQMLIKTRFKAISARKMSILDDFKKKQDVELKLGILKEKLKDRQASLLNFKWTQMKSWKPRFDDEQLKRKYWCRWEQFLRNATKVKCILRKIIQMHITQPLKSSFNEWKQILDDGNEENLDCLNEIPAQLITGKGTKALYTTLSLAESTSQEINQHIVSNIKPSFDFDYQRSKQLLKSKNILEAEQYLMRFIQRCAKNKDSCSVAKGWMKLGQLASSFNRVSCRAARNHFWKALTIISYTLKTSLKKNELCVLVRIAGKSLIGLKELNSVLVDEKEATLIAHRAKTLHIEFSKIKSCLGEQQTHRVNSLLQILHPKGMQDDEALIFHAPSKSEEKHEKFNKIPIVSPLIFSKSSELNGMRKQLDELESRLNHIKTKYGFSERELEAQLSTLKTSQENEDAFIDSAAIHGVLQRISREKHIDLLKSTAKRVKQRQLSIVMEISEMEVNKKNLETEIKERDEEILILQSQSQKYDIKETQNDVRFAVFDNESRKYICCITSMFAFICQCGNDLQTDVKSLYTWSNLRKSKVTKASQFQGDSITAVYFDVTSLFLGDTSGKIIQILVNDGCFQDIGNSISLLENAVKSLKFVGEKDLLLAASSRFLVASTLSNEIVVFKHEFVSSRLTCFSFSSLSFLLVVGTLERMIHVFNLSAFILETIDREKETLRKARSQKLDNSFHQNKLFIEINEQRKVRRKTLEGIKNDRRMIISTLESLLGSTDSSKKKWKDSSTRKQINLSGHGSAISAVSINNFELLSLDEKGKVLIWNISSDIGWSKQLTPVHSLSPTSAFKPSEIASKWTLGQVHVIVSTSKGRLFWLDFITGDEIAELKTPRKLGDPEKPVLDITFKSTDLVVVAGNLAITSFPVI